MPELAQKMANGKEKCVDREADPGAFAGWLIAHGYAMPVDHSWVYVGNYSDRESEFGVRLKAD